MANRQEESPEVARREFLSTLVFWGATIAAVGALGIPTVRFAIGKSLEAAEKKWISVGAIDRIPTGNDFKAVVYQFRTKDAWREVTKEGLLYARAEGSDRFTVYSAVCSHLGCNVRWQKDEGRFACPCHAGFYDPDGNVISGPPPQPLTRLETRVKDGVVEALL